MKDKAEEEMILVPCDSDSSVYSFVDECLSFKSLKVSPHHFGPIKEMEQQKGQPEFTARNLEHLESGIKERRKEFIMESVLANKMKPKQSKVVNKIPYVKHEPLL